MVQGSQARSCAAPTRCWSRALLTRVSNRRQWSQNGYKGFKGWATVSDWTEQRNGNMYRLPGCGMHGKYAGVCTTAFCSGGCRWLPLLLAAAAACAAAAAAVCSSGGGAPPLQPLRVSRSAPQPRRPPCCPSERSRSARCLLSPAALRCAALCCAGVALGAKDELFVFGGHLGPGLGTMKVRLLCCAACCGCRAVLPALW